MSDKKKNDFLYLGYLAEFGMTIAISIICGLGAGIFLDKKLDTKIFTLIFTIFGIIGGFLGVYKTIIKDERTKK